jgi:hypothetical protein
MYPLVQYVSADGFDNLDQIKNVNYIEYFIKIHPEKDMDQISKKTEEMRTLINSELWKMIYRVVK